MNPVPHAAPRHAARRVVAALSAVVLTLGALVGLGTTSAAAASQVSTASMLKAVNKARANNGVGPLSSNAALTSLALQHSKRMAAQDSLHHNPNLSTDVTGYRLVGENVGYSTIGKSGPASAVNTVHKGLLNSPPHLKNILESKFTQVGIAAVSDGKKVWVTQVFRQPKGSSGGGSTEPKPKKTKKKSTAPKTSQSKPKAAKPKKKAASKPKVSKAPKQSTAPRSPRPSAPASPPASKPAAAPETTPSSDPEPSPEVTETPSSAPTLTERVLTASAAAVPAPDPVTDALAFARAMHTVGG